MIIKHTLKSECDSNYCRFAHASSASARCDSIS